MSRSKRDYSGSLGTFWGTHSIRDAHDQPGNPKTGSEKHLPSETSHLSPHKAEIMLHEGTVKGHKITERQRKFFGVMASKKK